MPKNCQVRSKKSRREGLQSFNLRDAGLTGTNASGSYQALFILGVTSFLAGLHLQNGETSVGSSSTVVSLQKNGSMISGSVVVVSMPGASSAAVSAFSVFVMGVSSWLGFFDPSSDLALTISVVFSFLSKMIAKDVENGKNSEDDRQKTASEKFFQKNLRSKSQNVVLHPVSGLGVNRNRVVG